MFVEFKLHGAFPPLDIAIQSSSDPDEDLFFAVHAAERNLVVDHGGFGTVPGPSNVHGSREPCRLMCASKDGKVVK